MSVSARAAEALVGAIPGAALGAATGMATYEPATAREWLLPDGRVGGRDLTAAESAERRRWILRAALGGATLGAAGAVGGSAARETLLRRQDLKDSKAVADAYLSRIRERAAKYKSNIWRADELGAFDPGKQTRAAGVLEYLEQTALQAPREAATHRSGQVFRGPSYVYRAYGDAKVPHPKNLGKERIHDAFQALGLRGNPEDLKAFDELVASGMSKTSAAALLDELVKTADAVTRPLGLGAAISRNLARVGEAMKPPRVVGAYARPKGVSSFMPKTIPGVLGSAGTPMEKAPVKLVGGMSTGVRATREAASKAKP